MGGIEHISIPLTTMFTLAVAGIEKQLYVHPSKDIQPDLQCAKGHWSGLTTRRQTSLNLNQACRP